MQCQLSIGERTMKKLIGALLFSLLISATARSQVGSISELARLYDYDQKAALDLKETVIRESAGVRVYDISYASPKGGRVTAYLVAPTGKGPFAGLVFGHWGNGNRTEFLPEAELYAEVGVVSVMIDYPWTRPAPWRRSLKDIDDPDYDHELYVQTVVDLRRAIDVLLARSDVDPQRIAYAGHSYGAQWGAILSAIDRRIKAAVLIGGIPDRAAIYLEHDDPDYVEWRARKTKEKIEKYLSVNARTDPIHYVSRAAPTPLLFQFARFEQYFNEAAMQRYAKAATDPKTVKWYDTGHDLNDIQALIDRADWLKEKIGFKSITPIIEKMLKKK
jgi:dienelactone hydrolase